MKSEIVGYRSKNGRLGAYQLLSKVPSKFESGKERAHLKSLYGSFDFWVDADKLEAAPPNTGSARRSGSCGCPCCVPRCHCGPECNCRGGNIYDC